MLSTEGEREEQCESKGMRERETTVGMLHLCIYVCKLSDFLFSVCALFYSINHKV